MQVATSPLHTGIIWLLWVFPSGGSTITIVRWTPVPPGASRSRLCEPSSPDQYFMSVSPYLKQSRQTFIRRNKGRMPHQPSCPCGNTCVQCYPQPTARSMPDTGLKIRPLIYYGQWIGAPLAGQETEIPVSTPATFSDALQGMTRLIACNQCVGKHELRQDCHVSCLRHR